MEKQIQKHYRQDIASKEASTPNFLDDKLMKKVKDIAI